MPSVSRTDTDRPAAPAPPTQAGARPVRTVLPSRLPRRWADLPAGLRWSLLVYLVSRVPVVAGLAAWWVRNPKQGITATLLRQDGWWYTRIAQHGYSSSLRAPVPNVRDYHHAYSDWAFFPGYSLVIKVVHRVTFLPYLPAAVVVAAVFGLLAVWAMYALGASFGGAPVGQATALFVAAWPGSGAFSLPYSEGLFVTAAALSLLFVVQERWVLAGLAGAVAGATRPTGFALVAATGVVALVHLVRRRDPRPLVTPVLSVAGIAAFVLYGWARTGDLMVWRHAENLWQQRLDFSKQLVTRSVPVLLHPGEAMHSYTGRLTLAHAVLNLVGAFVLAGMIAAAVRFRRRLSLAWVVYAAVAVVLIVSYSAVATRPRMMLTLLPGFVWLAAWLPRRVTYALAGVFLLAMPFVMYLWSWRVTP